MSSSSPSADQQNSGCANTDALSMKADVEQGVLIVCCSSLPPSQLIEGITGENVSGKQEAVFGSRTVDCYPWHIATKYYDADVHFLLLPERDLVSESFSETVEAAVFHIDLDTDSFATLQAWMPFVTEFQPEIKILACDNAPEAGPVSRIQIQNWCIDNSFEFVELNPTIEEENDEVEDDFHESNSYLRIRQALHAHPWPMLQLKDCPQYTPSEKFRDILPSPAGEAEPTNREVADPERVASLVDETEKIFEHLHVEDESSGDFENLFQKFQEMKEKASQLPGNERLLFAEKTALAFWKAMGGRDEDDDQEPEADAS